MNPQSTAVRGSTAGACATPGGPVDRSRADPPVPPPGAPSHPLEAGLDVHHDRPIRTIIDSSNDDIRQADQQLAHARRVELQQGLRGLDGVGTTDSWSPCPANRGPSPTPPHPAQIQSAD